ncbi:MULTISPECIES: alanine racemase [Pseudoalteromonas]|uniref:alanine racemase n=1 Tax=Pseudoalteromonas TaxID=53246 RepID=UPI00097F4FBB|nr:MULTISPECIES: alanine racemase [Pseudoalteromonas]MBB1372224.1 alanine racemase [Pseudoalteromonas sp. SR45-4]MBE0421201.1 alanine racemase [Pseudoalteromonas nigrifaciens]MBH0070428.1 alanine racemase [Pseudoalteromonas sp. NZS127]PCC13569.1 alanine racemase [Pseudoalteromonas sp. JB197]WMS93951.1 alanine racemase [Pseudoalteromonas sp. HL-AS2]|tara:strand:- start:5777 stop:6856 length:1080 start_codon:yes stop_codon:yes gene_type:complete
MRLAIAEINLTALAHNLAQVKSFAPNSKVMAVLKANAYGHGLVTIAQHLNDADAFAVARIDEALALRAGGLTKPIVLLEGFFDEADLPILLANNFQTIIHDENQLAALENAQLEAPINCWLKINTGMHRLGIAPDQFDEFYNRLQKTANANNTVNLMTHFSCADDVDSSKTMQQIALFNRLAENVEQAHCLSNSAGILAWPSGHGDWVRPGLMLYGVSPMANTTGKTYQLEPVMRLTTKVIAVRNVAAHEAVGYSGRWQSDKPTQLAVVAMGYGDGYPRHARAGTPVIINKQRYGIVGSVAMDMITLDIGNNTHNIKVGDEVTMWGPELPVEEIAQCADTIPYELLCNITPRVSYQYQR